MKLDEYVDKIVQNNNPEEMKKLKDIFYNVMCDLNEYDHEKYRKYKKKLKGLAYNYQIDEELAKEIVTDMKPAGEYWNMETIANVANASGQDLINMYVIMNSLYNDYRSVINPDEANTYVNLARAWLNDEDAKPRKLWNYFID